MDKEIKDLRPLFIANIKVESTRVVMSNTPIVLLCGGFVDNHASPHERRVLEIKSLRHVITHKLYSEPREFEPFLPETITSWMDDGLFPDLVNYEEELAAICTCVVVILESPGSIAELGAFSQNQEMRSKLFVIKSSFFSDPLKTNSFINLGILRHLVNGDAVSTVEEYPWNIDTPQLVEETVIDDILDSIEVNLLQYSDTQILNLNNSSHTTVFICELISIFIALKLQEILRYMQSLGFQLDKTSLQRKLFLLEKFQVIVKHNYGGTDFYLSNSTDFHSVTFGYQKGRVTPQDLKLMTHQYYKAVKDNKRLGAIRDVKRKL